MGERADAKGRKGREEVARVYFLCGEPYPRDRLVATLRREVLGAEASAFNLDLLEAKQAGAPGILAAVRTLPMLGGQRLVQVRAAHELAAEELNKLIPYLQDPSPHSVLLMTADKVDLRVKFFGVLKKSGVLKRFEALRDRQVPAWLAEEARGQGIRLGPGAALRIAEAVGTDMGQLASALERVWLYAGGRESGAVTVAHVEEVLAQTRQHSIFELTNAVGRGQRREALLVLRRMQQSREPAHRVLAMLARHLRQLWSVKELAESRSSKETIASRLGIPPFFIGDLIGQARRFDAARLERVHRALDETDRALKSSRLPDFLILEQLVLQLCASPG